MKTSALNATGYHIHFYCKPAQLAPCREIRAALLDSVPSIEGAGPVRDVPVGPHPLPMFEAWFPTPALDEVVRWTMANRRGLSVLIHPLSGDDYSDHAEHALWLGEQLTLNLKIFQAAPSGELSSA